MTKTDWYPGTTKPVRVGVYERNLRDMERIVFSLWDGKEWRTNEYTTMFANNAHFGSHYQNLMWRGLTKR